MRKMTLGLDTLRVESFDTLPRARGVDGTVLGYQVGIEPVPAESYDRGCGTFDGGETCKFTCAGTCGRTCDSCDASCNPDTHCTCLATCMTCTLDVCCPPYTHKTAGCADFA
jgi:hypothetical protein